MAFVEALGGKVTRWCEGSVLAEGDLATVQADPRVIEVYLGPVRGPRGVLSKSQPDAVNRPGARGIPSKAAAELALPGSDQVPLPLFRNTPRGARSGTRAGGRAAPGRRRSTRQQTTPPKSRCTPRRLAGRPNAQPNSPGGTQHRGEAQSEGSEHAEAYNLNQYYGGSHILRGLSFDVPVGQVTTLLGSNGVGKTTLLKTLMGLVPAASGSIAFDGQDITRAPSYKRVAAGIGFVPQGREIFPRLSVEENLLMGLGHQPRGSAIPPRIFDMFPVLKQMMDRRGGDLSGGQQQQLAIGRALAFGPKLLILDEPTEGILSSIIKDIERAIRSLAETGEISSCSSSSTTTSRARSPTSTW